MLSLYFIDKVERHKLGSLTIIIKTPMMDFISYLRDVRKAINLKKDKIYSPSCAFHLSRGSLFRESLCVKANISREKGWAGFVLFLSL